jgi:hypothetical protein
VPDWSAEERALSRKVLRLAVMLGDPQHNERWISRSMVAGLLNIDPDDEMLYNAVALLIKEGDAESGTSARRTLRATPHGQRKVPKG